MVVSKWLVHKDAKEGIDYELDKLTEVWTTTNLQDRWLAENNQRGVNGLGYAPGPYSQQAEEFVIRFSNWYHQAARAAALHRSRGCLNPLRVGEIHRSLLPFPVNLRS